MSNILLIDQIATTAFKYTFSLARELSKRNRVDLFVDHVGIFAEDQKNSRLFVHRCFNTDSTKSGKIWKVLNYFHSYLLILKFLKKNHVDVVETQWFSFSPLDYFFLKKIAKKCKIINIVHDVLPFCPHKYDYHYFPKIYKLASSIICQSQESQQRFFNLCPNLVSKVVVIPHGNFLGFGETVDKKFARKTLGVPADAFVFLFFGQIKKVKGVDIALQAFSRVLSGHPDCYFLLAGKLQGTKESDFLDICGAEERERMKFFFGFVPEESVKYYFNAADVVLLPYTDLYQSGVVQLSYAYKKVAIVSDLPAFLDVVVDGSTAFVCQKNSVESLTDKMNLAISCSQTDLAAMGEKGAAYISRKFSWSSIAEKMESLF